MKKRITKTVEKYKDVEFQTPFKNKGGRIRAKIKIKLERGDDKLNVLEIDDIRMIYNYYKKDKVPVGIIDKGVPVFIKRKAMLKYLNGEFPKRHFRIPSKLKRMRINAEEAKALMKPWIGAEKKR